MAKLDVYRTPRGVMVVEVRHDLMTALTSTIVAPLYPLERSPPPMKRLNPVFEIGGARYVMATQLLGSIPRRELGAPVGSLPAERGYDVTNALDMLFTGI
jgi:toxin CcdB